AYTGDPFIVNGSYNLKASGALNEELKGQIRFELKTIEDISSGNYPITTLKLDFGSAEETSSHTVGFIISGKHMARQSLIGTYGVTDNTKGFLNHYNRVFGFADINNLGEQSFFAYGGSINVTDVHDDALHGNLKVNFRDFEGETMQLTGDFIATK
ncbi:MAG: hypothetical protein HKN31_10295, partial [Pricia sp.]|nr:hypothetical protein [Pricia sp.]